MKNWKTTFAGLLSGAFVLVPQIANLIASSTDASQHVDWSKVAMGAGLIVIGALAKDHNVTGGTVPQTAEAATRTPPQS